MLGCMLLKKYKFSLNYRELTYPITVEAQDEEEAHNLFSNTISLKMFPTNTEIEDFRDEFHASWDIDSVEVSCLNCGETPEWVGYEEDDFTMCPKGCFIAF